jgi:hypothetical protein
MAKVGSYGAGPQGTNPDDETTPINKEKFKQQLKKVDAVEKTDPDQKSKKRKPGKEEEDIEQASQAIQAAPTPPTGGSPMLGLLGASSSSQVSATDSTSSDTSAPQSYTPQGTPPQAQDDEDASSQTSSPSEAENTMDTPLEMDYNDLDYDNPSWPESSTSNQNPVSPSQTPSSAKKNEPYQRKPVERPEGFSHKKSLIQPKQKLPFHKNKEQFRQELKVTLQQYEHDLKLEPLEKKQSLLAPKSAHTPKEKPHIDQSQKHETFEESSLSLKDDQKEEPKAKQQAFLKKSEAKLKETKSTHSQKQEEKKEQKVQGISDTSSTLWANQAPTVPINEPPPTPEPPAKAGYLSPEVHELFQTMIGLVMVKQISGEGGPASEMEIALTNPEYANSKFFGLTIKITEFKSAPGSYNIELVGSSDQTKILEEQKRKLISALNDNRYSLPFTVNRLDVSLKKEDKEFLFKRKESVKGDHKDASNNQTS